MAKQTWKITIVAVIAIVGIVLTVGTILWGQGESHGVEAAQVKANKEDIAEIKPEVKLNTEGRIDVQADVKWIKGSLERIEKKL